MLSERSSESMENTSQDRDEIKELAAASTLIEHVLKFDKNPSATLFGLYGSYKDKDVFVAAMAGLLDMKERQLKSASCEIQSRSSASN